MGLSRTVSEINGKIFSPLYLMPPLREFPLDFLTAVLLKRLASCPH